MAVWTVHAHDSLSLPANSVEWSSIPTDYDHLFISVSCRSDETGLNESDCQLQVGGAGSIDASNYGWTYIYSTGTWPAIFSSTGTSFNYLYGARDGINSTVWANWTVWIPNYQSIYWTTMIADCAVPNQSASANEFAIQNYAGTWKDVAVLTNVKISLSSGSADFLADSKFTLYGITGAA